MKFTVRSLLSLAGGINVFVVLLLAAQVLEPGVYCVIHNKVLRFPGVVKDHARGTFRYADTE